MQVTLIDFENATLPATFAEFIQQLAKIYALPTQVALAERVNIPVRTLRSYMHGDTHPRKNRVVELEELTGLNLSRFYEDTRVEVKGEPVVDKLAEWRPEICKESIPYVDRASFSSLLSRKIDEVKAQIAAEPRARIDDIIKRREALGLSCVEFAKRAGLNKHAWKRIEDGVPNKNRRNLIRAASTRLDKMESHAKTKAGGAFDFFNLANKVSAVS